MVKLSKFIVVIVFTLMPQFLFSQEDDLLAEEPAKSVKAATADFAFKTTKVINLQSSEVTDVGVLDFKMMHRFGALNAGAYEAFGLDQATVRFGFEYGIMKNLMVSAGRSNVRSNKNLDFLVKYKLLSQTQDNSMPVSVLFTAGAQYLIGTNVKNTLTDKQRSSYFGQAIVTRKFNDDFSLLLSPTVLINAKSNYDQSTQVALGIGMRQKISVRSSINLEYIPVLTKKGDVYNSFSVGLDVETGGHVFQFHLTNSMGLNESQFISNSVDQWNAGGIRLGFNLSRVFTIVKPKGF
jgi:hypothetical protein